MFEGSNLKSIGAIDIPFAESSFKLYPKINGADAFDSYFATADINYLTFENGDFKVNKTGTSRVAIGNSTVSVNVYAEKVKYELAEDFEDKESVLVSGVGETFDEWIGYSTSAFAYYNGDLSNLSDRYTLNFDIMRTHASVLYKVTDWELQP